MRDGDTEQMERSPKWGDTRPVGPQPGPRGSTTESTSGSPPGLAPRPGPRPLLLAQLENFQNWGQKGEVTDMCRLSDQARVSPRGRHIP